MTGAELVLPMMLGTALLTFGIRYLPLALLGGRRLRPLLERFLRSLPIGILCAMAAQSTFLRGGTLSTGIDNYYLHGIVVGVLLAFRTRSLSAVVFGGLAMVALMTLLGSA